MNKIKNWKYFNKFKQNFTWIWIGETDKMKCGHIAPIRKFELHDNMAAENIMIIIWNVFEKY